MPLDGGTIGSQVGAAMGLWTHTPVDWRGNETGVPPPGPAGWPTDAFVAVPPNGSPASATGGATVITAISVSGITTTGATVNFTLSQQSTCWVEYGTTAAYGTTNTQGAGIGPQSKNLTGLTTGTLYHYRVVAQDVATSITTYSPDGTFTTS